MASLCLWDLKPDKIKNAKWFKSRTQDRAHILTEYGHLAQKQASFEVMFAGITPSLSRTASPLVFRDLKPDSTSIALPALFVKGKFEKIHRRTTFKELPSKNKKGNSTMEKDNETIKKEFIINATKDIIIATLGAGTKLPPNPDAVCKYFDDLAKGIENTYNSIN